MKTVNIHIKNTKNIADLFCNASRYYEINAESEDFSNLNKHYNSNIVFGGGMLLKKLDNDPTILSKIKGKKISWGAGCSRNQLKSYNYSKRPFIKKFDLFSTRDYGLGLEYVPCPSCKNSLFQKKYKIKNDIIVYSNKLSKNLKITDFPSNDNENMSLEETIEFIGSANTVITSSYHGVYWSMLLNKNVICIPFNAKFFNFKHSPEMCYNPKDIKKHLNSKQNYEGFLQECIEINDNFFKKVTNILND